MDSGTVEIITGRERRRRWSVADKLRILAECDAPGVQVAEVAARHGVYRSLVFQWRRQARDGLLVAERTPEFVPVRVAADRHGEAIPEPEPVPPPPTAVGNHDDDVLDRPRAARGVVAWRLGCSGFHVCHVCPRAACLCPWPLGWQRARQ
ncbi:IS66-like element accessory protein TnpA [Belnapia rosea]|uniref:IS66-like element accessory protein TnpA n=1 Tax=Belnapia rosea TaxID=938405 RepID=UPI000B83F44A